MRVKRVRFAMLIFLLCFGSLISSRNSNAQNPPPQQPAVAPAPKIQAPSVQSHGAVRLSLDEAIQLALQNNHNLKAAETTIQQNQAQEITANLRPNPVFTADAQFLPIFQPENFTATYIDNVVQFDLGVQYLFERGKKRQHRLQAAQDTTAETQSTVADNERTLTFNVASQFINVQLAESTLELAIEDLKSFQNTVDISQARYKAGDISEDDYLKIKLQLLQFQTDVSQAQLAKHARARRTCGNCSDTNPSGGLRRAGRFRLPAGHGKAGRSADEGAADRAGSARGATGRHCGEQPVRTAQGQSAKADVTARSTTPT